MTTAAAPTRTPVVLVTGGARGLGLAVARRLAEDGLAVVLGARRRDAGDHAAAGLRAEGHDAGCVELDVRDPESARAAADEIGRRHGRLDALVNNAGILPEATEPPTSEALSFERFRATYATNVLGAVAVTVAMLPLLRAAPSARVVNVSSRMGSLADQQDPGSEFHALVVPAYQSSKAALDGVTVALAKALAGTQVRVNSVCPGFVRTDLTPANREQAPLSAEEAAEVVARYAHPAVAAPTGGFLDAAGTVPW